jgi:hypothetical protein
MIIILHVINLLDVYYITCNTLLCTCVYHKTCTCNTFRDVYYITCTCIAFWKIYYMIFNTLRDVYCFECNTFRDIFLYTMTCNTFRDVYYITEKKFPVVFRLHSVNDDNCIGYIFSR